MWHVYILQCADSLLYTGSTTDIDRRVKEHNAKKGGGCTRGRWPGKLVHKEPYPNRSEARSPDQRLVPPEEIEPCKTIGKTLSK